MLQPCLFSIQKHIKGFPTYTVNTDGVIRSLGTGMDLRTCSNTGGYQSVQLYGEDKSPRVLVHRIVLSSFLGIEPDKSYVDHKDNNPRNNALSNLKWVTQAENIQRSYDIGRSKSPKHWTGKNGKLHHRSILIIGYDDNGVEKIRFESICIAKKAGYNIGFYGRNGKTDVAKYRGLTFKKVPNE